MSDEKDVPKNNPKPEQIPIPRPSSGEELTKANIPKPSDGMIRTDNLKPKK